MEREDDQLTSVAALGDPLRRALYRYVVSQPVPVNRDQAAQGVGIARHTAKFHLDKLVADGLLEVEFARPPGRTGPGAGRPAKFFRRAAGELAVTLPPRHYDLAGRLLAKAVTEAQRDSIPVRVALARAARDWGRTLGDDVRRRLGRKPDQSTARTATSEALQDCGYEPRTEPDGLTLANCPFHTLAQDYTDLVRGMNLELIDGLVGTIDATGLQAVLDPSPGRCCVRLVTCSETPPTVS